MVYFIATILIITFLFLGVFLYKLSDVKWYHQFLTNDFEDRDIFTRLVKFLMSLKNK